MRTKLITSALAFVSALLLSGYVFLSAKAGRPLRCAEFARFSGVVLRNSILHYDENGGGRSLRLAEAALHAPVSYETMIAGRRYSVPLPAYSVPYGEGFYFTFSDSDELQIYIHETLPRAGWEHADQMGAGYFFVRGDMSMTIARHFYLGTGISEMTISLRERGR